MRGKNLAVLVVLFIVLNSFIYAGDYMALQGNVDESGVALSSGDVQVVIWDALSGGNIVYNSSSDFNSAISSGKYDVLLGNGSVSLDLEYGKKYYLELYVNKGSGYEKFEFNGLGRQVFQSSIGNVSFSYINNSQSIVLTSNSPTFDAGQNVTVGTGGWFKGLFNWVLSPITQRYFSFNGSTLDFNESVLNGSIDARASLYNESGMILSVNSSLWGEINSNSLNWNSTYNSTYASLITNPVTYNSTYEGYSTTYSLYWINHTSATYNAYNGIWSSTYNSSYLTSFTESDLIALGVINGNLTNWLNTYNSSYSLKDGGNAFTGVQTFDGDFGSGGVRISNGDIFAQQLYVYNISSLDVSNLAINGSAIPTVGFDGSFNLGSSNLRWQNAYLSGNVYSNGTVHGVNFIGDGSGLTNVPTYNSTYANLVTNPVTYNSTYEGYSTTYSPYWINHTSATYNAYNGIWSSTYNSSYLTSFTESDLIALGVINGNLTNWLSTYNSTYQTWAYNQTAPAVSYVDGVLVSYYTKTQVDNNLSNYYTKTLVDSNLSLRLLVTDQRYNESALISSMNASWLASYNSTYDAKNSSLWNNLSTGISYSSGRVGIGVSPTVGMLEISDDGSLGNYGLKIDKVNLGTSNEYGIYSYVAEGGDSANSYGVYGKVYSLYPSSPTSNKGLSGEVHLITGDTATTNYGVYTNVTSITGPGDVINYGVYGHVYGPGAINYAVYGDAESSSGTNWAGYFDDGNVYVKNNLTLGGKLTVNGDINLSGSLLGNVPTYNSTYASLITNPITYNSTYDAKNTSKWFVSSNDIYYGIGLGAVGIGRIPNGVIGALEVNNLGNYVSGIDVDSDSSGTGSTYGVNSYSSDTGGYGDNVYGVYGKGYSDPNGNVEIIGVKGDAVINGDNGYILRNYGLLGNASGVVSSTGAITNYGVYGSSQGTGATNWAGYFEDGNVYVKNNLTHAGERISIGSGGSTLPGITFNNGTSSANLFYRSPSLRIESSANFYSAGYLFSSSDVYLGASSRIIFGSSTSNNRYIKGVGATTSNVSWHIGSATAFFNLVNTTSGEGRLGIGTTNPAQTLQVIGTANVSSDAYMKNVHLAGHSDTAILSFGPYDTFKIYSSSINNNSYIDNVGGGDMLFTTFNGSVTKTNIFIDSSANSVGIGTITPSARLNVVDGTTTAINASSLSIGVLGEESTRGSFGMIGYYDLTYGYGGYFRNGTSTDYAVWAEGPLRAREYQSSDGSKGATQVVNVYGSCSLTFKNGIYISASGCPGG